MLGGDNAVTRPGCHALNRSLNRCGLLTLDAHLDLRDLTRGLSNGNPVRALLDDGLPGRNIVQIGIQSFANSQAYARVASETGIRVVTKQEIRASSVEALVSEALAELAVRADQIYVDLDLDVLDRIFAPATPGSAGRPRARRPSVVARICGAHPKVRAMDLASLIQRATSDATVMVAGACLLSFASGFLDRPLS